MILSNCLSELRKKQNNNAIQAARIAIHTNWICQFATLTASLHSRELTSLQLLQPHYRDVITGRRHYKAEWTDHFFSVTIARQRARSGSAIGPSSPAPAPEYYLQLQIFNPLFTAPDFAPATSKLVHACSHVIIGALHSLYGRSDGARPNVVRVLIRCPDTFGECNNVTTLLLYMTFMTQVTNLAIRYYSHPTL